MSYIKKHLMPGEYVEHETQLHWMVYLPAYIFLALAITLFAVVMRQGAENRELLPIPAVFLGAALLAMLVAATYRNSAEFAVTNKRVIVKTGFLSRRSTEILLRQVEAISVNQGLLGRMFDYGTITIEGTGVDRVPYPRIAGPMAFRLSVQEQIEKLMTPAPVATPQQAAASGGDPYAKLLKLNELREKGILTDAEFAAEKRKILG